MKNIKILIVFAAILISANSVMAQGIEWFKGSLEEAKAQALKENKKIYLYVYTTWWGPCRGLKKDVYPSKEVGKVFNKYFINVAVDAEKGNGKEIAKAYGVKGYPSLYFCNADGKVYRQANHFGATEPEKFARVGRIAVGKEKKTWEWYQRQYRKGNRKTQFLKDYIQARMNAIKYYATDELNWELAMSYPEKKLFCEENQKFIISKAEWKNKFVDFIIENRSMFTLLNEPKWEKQLVRGLLMTSSRKKDKAQAYRGIEFSFPKYFPMLKEFAEIDNVRLKGDHKGYLEKLFAAAEKYGEEPSGMSFMVPIAASQAKDLSQDIALKCLKFYQKEGLEKSLRSWASYVDILWKAGKEAEAKELAKKYPNLIKENEGKSKFQRYIDIINAVLEGNYLK